MSTSPIQLRADWIRIVEATQEASSSEQAWLDGLVGACTDALRFPLGIGSYVIEHDASCETRTMRAAALPSEFKDQPFILPPQFFRAAHYPPHRATTHSEMLESLPEEDGELLRTMQRAAGIDDMLGVVAHPMPGTVIVLFALHPRTIRLTRHERTVLEQASLHMETGYRLLRGKNAVQAELTASGEIVHREEDAPSERALTDRARSVREARTKSRRADSRALDLWPALIAGRLSLVDRGSAARRRYLVIENAAASQPIRALTDRELDVLSHAANGLSLKMVAYALGMSPSLVSTMLASCAAKLGVATTIELVRIAAMLARDPRARFETTALTTTEREVLELVRSGLSNQRIAEIRSRSVRTIANQVAALLRKTNSPTRRALVARH